jgi:hypothetical protein
VGEMNTTFAWAVLYPTDRGFGRAGAPSISSVAHTREEAMHGFVASWRTGDHDGMTVSKVWQRAYRRGWRLARVAITPALGYNQ